MRSVALGVATILALTTAVAHGQTQQIPQAQTGNAASGDSASASSGARQICRTEDQLGSRLGSHRVCMTADQWRQAARDQAMDIERRQRAPSPNPY